MSKLNIACLLSPMADTEGPMDIENGTALTGAKKIMGKYGEVGLEATITYGESHPDQIHTDILSIGKSKEVTGIQQTAIAMFQPAKHPGSLGVHALELDDIDTYDAFAIAGLLEGMVGQLENKPDLIFAGRESSDYSHGVVGPALAEKLGYAYYSGVNEVKINDDMKTVTATFIEGNDKVILDIQMPAVFGTTDWLNGKDSARFTSLKGVMMAKKFKRNIVSHDAIDLGKGQNKTRIDSIEPVKSERKNRTLAEGEGGDKAKEAIEILVNQDKALDIGSGSESGGGSELGEISWEQGDPVNLGEDVIVIADHDGNQIRQSTHKTLGIARKVADQQGKSVTLLIFAESQGQLANSAVGFGADRVVLVQNPAFKNSTIQVLSEAFGQVVNNPQIVITVATDLGRDLAAFLASKSNGGLLQDVVDLEANDNLVGTRVVSNARFQTKESFLPEAESKFVSVRAAALDPVADDRAPKFFQVTLSEALPSNSTLNSIVQGAEVKGIPLNEAKIIFSGGRGMKAPENFAKLQELADLLGGAVGASRAVTDLEWVPHNLQIGQTGTTVAPDVYFAVGISGAIQHLTGMLGSKYIVAINHDADAPIHKHADLSIVDKWENVLPQLTQEFKNLVG